MQKLSFSGHESFICKQFWLKKVYDFSTKALKFSDDRAVVHLGVGKNMVASLRYWGKSFGILDDLDLPTNLANYLFADDGQDPYLEDIATLWLLHYQLVRNNRASTYSFVFNEFRKERIDFTKEHLHAFLKRKCEQSSQSLYNLNTINTDINVFLRNYVKPNKDDKIDIEDDFTGLLIDLDMVKHYKQKIDDKLITTYRIEGQDRADLPAAIVLYAILESYPGQKTINFRELQTGMNSPGLVFALNSDGLYNKVEQIARLYREIIFTETAGDQILQIKSDLQPIEILNDYYQNN